MSVLKPIRELAKDLPIFKSVLNSLEQQLINLRKTFPNAQSRDIKNMVNQQSKNRNVRSMQNGGKSKIEDEKASLLRDNQMTRKEIDKLEPKHQLDINYQEKSLSFDSLIQDVSSVKTPRPVNPPYSPPSSTLINRYAVDKGFGNKNIGNLLGP